MTLDRRSFMQGVAASMAALTVAARPAAAAVVANPAPVISEMPVLYDDGIRNAAPALNALFRREAVLYRGKVLQARDGVVYVPPGQYLIDQPIVVDGDNPVMLSGSTMYATADFDGPMIDLSAVPEHGFVEITRNEFEHNGTGPCILMPKWASPPIVFDTPQV